MPGRQTDIAQLFARPGRTPTGAAAILRRAAGAHEQLLRIALSDAVAQRCPVLRPLVDHLPPDPRSRQIVLTDPVVVNGLHDLASASPKLHEWHACIVGPNTQRRVRFEQDTDVGNPGRMLGNAAVAMLLRADHNWCGRVSLKTDQFGLIRFPLSDWSLSLTTNEEYPQLASEEPVWVQLGPDLAIWGLGRHLARPIMQMSRRMLVQMLARNTASPDVSRLQALDPWIHPRWQRSVRLCRGGIRFLPVEYGIRQLRSEICGGLIQTMHNALRHTSPAIHREFCRYMKVAFGFWQPGNEGIVLQSFSDATQPRQMGFNVPFTVTDEPRLCPHCYTWLGHEMAHTKMYLIGSIGWSDGWQLLENGEQRTSTILRYGRSLAVRTLFQIPYTHFYEWTQLMDTCGSRSHDSAWLTADPVQFGDDLRCEIEQAFDIISTTAELTPQGHVAMQHFRQLFADVDARWCRVRRFITRCQLAWARLRSKPPSRSSR